MTDAPATAASFDHDRDDATFLHARREAKLIFLAWALALIWAVPYCYFNGFSNEAQPLDPETMPLILGIPSWVFWGVGFPWLMADLFTVWLCFFYMEDDDLGEAHEGEDVADDIAQLHSSQESGSST